MWNNDVPTDVPTDAPRIGAAQVASDRSATCATCERPAPSGKLRCDPCVSLEWEKLKAADPAWYERHRMYRRQTAGGDT